MALDNKNLRRCQTLKNTGRLKKGLVIVTNITPFEPQNTCLERLSSRKYQKCLQGRL